MNLPDRKPFYSNQIANKCNIETPLYPMLTIFIMYVLLLLFMFLYVLLQYCIVLLSYILYFGNMQCTHIQYTTPSFVWYNYFNFPETSCNNHERKIPIKCENCQLGKKSNFSLITHESKLRFMYSTF